jgi:hypothetical protein
MTAAGNCVVTTKTGSCGPLPMTALVYKNNFSTIDKVFIFTSRTLSGITYTGAAWSSPIHESGSFIQRFDREVDDYAPSLSSCTLDCGPGMHIE